jgi:hypothetical protein
MGYNPTWSREGTLAKAKTAGTISHSGCEKRLPQRLVFYTNLQSMCH